MALKGFVIRDESGIFTLIPEAQKTKAAQEMAMNYIKKNQVIQTVYSGPDEDFVDFALRLQEMAKHWQRFYQQRQT